VKTRSLEREGQAWHVRAFSLPPDGQNRLERKAVVILFPLWEKIDPIVRNWIAINT
jgi:hypothetical protein